MEFLNDTNIVVTIAFVAFVSILLYVGVPKIIAKLLDDRAAGIRSELEEARALREEAQTLLASFERKQKEVRSQAEAIVEAAREEAHLAADMAKDGLKASIKRRMQAAKDQIASAEAAAVRDVRDRAISVAVAAASEVIAKKMPAEDGASLIDASIADVGDKLH